MCGIVGIIRQSAPAVHRVEAERFANALSHRGPDGMGIWLSADSRVALGHTRLSILDLSHAASQPMVSAESGHAIAFNGEIYNFIELRAELEQAGFRFQSNSDTEVLLHGWRHWGLSLFPRLNGMWAFAIFDRESGETLLCRDRFGVKPLYYHHSSEQFLFASEVQAIDRFTRNCLELDPAFYAPLKQLEVGVGTHLRGVNAVLPGTFLIVRRDGTIQEQQWYRLGAVVVPQRFEEQVEAFRELIADACLLRLRSDVPVATCLSGGIDSGSIVSLLNTQTRYEARFPGFNHRSFTAAFPGTDLDETAAAKMLAEVHGVSLDVKVMECPGVEDFERALAACDGPMPTMAFFPIWKLYQHVRQQGILVTLDGMGPDEMLGGYFAGAEAIRGAWQLRDPRWFVDVYGTYAALYENGGAWMKRELIQFSRELGSAGKQRLRQAIGMRATAPIKELPPLPPWVPEGHPHRNNPFARLLWHQFFAAPLPFFLHQYDRCSMANGIEARMPFMDYRVVEFAYSLPLQTKVGGGYTKRVLREAVKGILPDTIRLNRRKTGFNAPFVQWLQGPLSGWAREIASTPEFVDNPCFDGITLSRTILKEGIQGSGATQEREVWPALHLAWWQRNRCAS